jgi:Tfp pilus assembly protein PilZ
MLIQKRVAKNLLAQAKFQNKSIITYIQEISDVGIGFTSNEDIAVGTPINMTINVPEHKNIKLAGSVVWDRPLPKMSKESHQYGMRISKKPSQYDAFFQESYLREFERRANRRYKVVLEVDSSGLEELYTASTEDVSADGFFLRTGFPLSIGMTHEMEIHLEPGTESVKCDVEVVSVFGCDPDQFTLPFGAGVRIVSFKFNGEQRFSNFLTRLDQQYAYEVPAPQQPAMFA